MKTNIYQTAAGYESPAVRILDILNEGVLCQSGDFGIVDWENDGESLDF